MALDGSSFDIG